MRKVYILNGQPSYVGQRRLTIWIRLSDTFKNSLKTGQGDCRRSKLRHPCRAKTRYHKLFKHVNQTDIIMWPYLLTIPTK